MRSYIVFSFLIVTACAASLGHIDEVKVSASTTSKTSVKPVEQEPETVHVLQHPTGGNASVSELTSKHVVRNDIIGVNKLKEAIEIVQQNNKDASNVGVKTLETFKNILSSEELNAENAKTNASSKTEEISKTERKGIVVSAKEKNEHDSTHNTSLTENHVHTRKTEELLRAGSGKIQNGDTFDISNIGTGARGVVSSERLIRTGGDIIRTDNLAGNGRLLRSENVVYNQGIPGAAGFLNTGKLVNSGGLINSGRILNSGSFIEPRNQIYNAGSFIGSGERGSGGLIQTGQVIGSGIQGANNDVLFSNYHSGNIGIEGQYQNLVEGNKRIIIGLDELNSVPQSVEYSKQFYHFEAPEEHHENAQITKQLSNVLKKNLQVVFINAPENMATTNAALQLAKQAIEQKTAIYVLSKEADVAQLVGHLEQIQENVQTNPEVRIIKYRTPEDLERAKFEIQKHHEATGGSTQSFNGGVVPILNYASNSEAYNRVGTLLHPGSISSTKLGGGHIADSSNIISAIGSAAHTGGGQSITSGKQALLESSVGQLNIIKSTNTGTRGLIGSGLLNSEPANVYNSNTGLSGGSLIRSNSVGAGLGSSIGSSSTIGSGSLQDPKTASLVQFEIGPQVGSNLGSSNFVSVIDSSGSIGSGSLPSSTISSPIQFGAGQQVGSNSESTKFVTGLGSSIGASSIIGSGALQGSTISSPIQFGIGTQVGSNSGSSKFFGTGPLIGSSNSLGSNSISKLNTGYTRELGSNSIVVPISQYPINSNGVLKTSLNAPSGSSSLVDSYKVGRNDGFGSSSLQEAQSGLSSGSIIGSSTEASNVIVDGSQPNSSGTGYIVNGIIGSVKQVGDTSSTLASGSGSQAAFNSGSSKVVEVGSLNSEFSSFPGYSQGATKLTSTGTVPTTAPLKINLISSSNLIENATLIAPTSSFGTGSLNTVGSGTLLGSISGSNNLGSSSLLGTGSSNNIGSGPLIGSSPVNKVTISKLGTGSTSIVGSESFIGSSPGNKGSISSFGTGSSKIPGSGSLLGSNSGINNLESSYSLETESPSTIENQPLLESSSDNKATISPFEIGASKIVGSGLGYSSGSNNLRSGVGSFASQLTVDSSKLKGSRSSTEHGNIASGSDLSLGSGTGASQINDGVSVLSSTKIDHELDGSKDSSSNILEAGSGYVSGLGIGSSIGEFVKEDNYIGSSSKKLPSIDVKKPFVNRKYLPPTTKQN